jgi:hypothetical protein
MSQVFGGRSQIWLFSQPDGTPGSGRLPQVLSHAPSEATLTPAAAATQALLYVVPSQPQTGSYSRVQFCGGIRHTPGASFAAEPQLADGFAQYMRLSDKQS